MHYEDDLFYEHAYKSLKYLGRFGESFQGAGFTLLYTKLRYRQNGRYCCDNELSWDGIEDGNLFLLFHLLILLVKWITRYYIKLLGYTVKSKEKNIFAFAPLL